MVRQYRDLVERVLRRYIKFGMIGAEVRRDPLRMMGFVIILFGKADRERLYRARRLALHQRDNRARIIAAR